MALYKFASIDGLKSTWRTAPFRENIEPLNGVADVASGRIVFIESADEDQRVGDDSSRYSELGAARYVRTVNPHVVCG